MVSATTLASPDPQVWQLLECAVVAKLAPQSGERMAGGLGRGAGVRGKVKATGLDVWLL